MGSVHRRRVFTGALAIAACAAIAAQPWRLSAQAPEPAKGVKFAQVDPADLKEWLGYLSSDELLGRETFTEGYGLAAQYVADHLKAWGVKPVNPDGTYLQPVRLKGYRVRRNSTATVGSGADTKTFRHGDHVTFSANSGGRQTVTFHSVEFVGYFTDDLRGRDVKGKLVVWLPQLSVPGGGSINPVTYNAIVGAAAGTIGYTPTPGPPTPAELALAQAQDALAQATTSVQSAQTQLGRARGLNPPATGRGQGSAVVPDLTTVRDVNLPKPPRFRGDDAFFEALFASAPVKFSEIKARAEHGLPIAPISFPVSLTVNIDNTFELVQEQITHNVVGKVEGSDPKLKDTYVLFGAHLDHIGYSQSGGGRQPSNGNCRERSAASQAALATAGRKVAAQQPEGRATLSVLPFEQQDLISNGADDDGSGSTAELAIAKAFATGPKPRRSVVFVWHAGEEEGLYGSEYNADFPIVALDRVQAQLNMDMVGRDDCDDKEGDYSNTLFVVGADRISTDLHNLIVQANQKQLSKPLTLDYELNDPADPEDVYERSDHFSYATKGVPIAFFTTGIHPDYHTVADTVEKILFPKMARIAQLVYQTGFAIANSDKVLDRDNKGPRTGLGSKAEVIKK